MLIEFRVSNFRSFGEDQAIRLTASKAKTGHENHCRELPARKESLLRLALVYGSNGSGKSNLVGALDFARELVVEGSSKLQRLKYMQFKFTDATAINTKFVFLFYSDERVFTYSFEVNEGVVKSESLIATGASNRSFKVFSRFESDITFGEFEKLNLADSQSEKAIKALADIGVRNNQLMLNKVLELEEDRRGDLFNTVVNWFVDSLVVIHANAKYESIVEFLDENQLFRQKTGEFLEAAGTGISDLTIEKTRIDTDQLPSGLVDSLQAGEATFYGDVSFPTGFSLHIDPEDHSNVIRRNLLSKHSVDNKQYPLPFFEESDGTNKLMNLLPAIIDSKGKNRVFIIDEVDRSLHPFLTKMLIQYFIEADPEGDSQLILTTHDTHLLDQSLVRRDEVWFVEKNDVQETRLKSLTDLGARKDLKIDKSYLQGRFGAIPFQNIEETVKNLLED